MNSKNGFLSNVKKETKSHMFSFFSFQLLVDFLNDSKSPAIKFFRTGFGYAYIFVYKFKNGILLP